MPPTLRRITTRYIEPEDRLRLAGDIDDGEPVVIWLTQRLIRFLLPALLRWLEENATTNRSTPPAQAEIQHSFAQQAARARQVSQPAVRISTGSTAWLAIEVRVAKTPGQLRLTFGGPDGQQAILELGTTHLRQWLNIVFDHSSKAGWPLEAWPEWVKDSTRPLTQSGVVLH